jgi:D-alanyl-D-alanine dipeptidase
MPPPWSMASSSTCAISAMTISWGRELTATSVRAACYRPPRQTRWAQRIDDIKRKPEFYPEVPKRDLFKEGYISERSAHSRGSTVDLTLVRRADARELDMGSPFDFFSPQSWPSDTSVSVQAQKNRALLAAAMMRGGFRPYDKEWWHYTLADEPFPDTYFDFPVR